MQDDTRKTILNRLGLIVVLLPICLVFSSVLILVGLLAWTIYEDLKPTQRLHFPSPRTWRDAKSDDSDWMTLFYDGCDSPAETEFLKSMIYAYSLLPHNGRLRGSDLTLDLQVNIQPYRVDFLINSWLVVEIDGATYHSLPEAIERDKIRDEFLLERGFLVLQIPAGVIFSTPAAAVERVSEMLRKKHYVTIPAPDANDQNNKSRSFVEVLSVINITLQDINSSVTTKQEIERYTKGFSIRFYEERYAIEKSIELAESEIQTSLFISESEYRRKRFQEISDNFYRVLDTKAKINQTQRTETSKSNISISPQPKNETHPDPKINEAIDLARKALLSERASFFESVRGRLNNNDTLKGLVRKKLDQLGYAECWQYIS